MSALGEDFAGGLFRRLYQPFNPAGLVFAIGAAVGLLLLHQLLQVVLSVAVLKGFFGGDTFDQRLVVKASLIVIFPASLAVAAVAWWLAGWRSGDARAVLGLRRPRSRRWAGSRWSPLSWS